MPRTQPSPKTKPAAPEPASDLKEACVRAAHEFIAEQGVERLSLREVARRLGVSHQAPYRHYPSRDHLLAEVMRRCFRRFAHYLDDRGEHADPRADLGALGRRYLAFAAEHPLEYRLMFGTPWPEPAGQPGLVEDARHALDVLRAVLRRIHGNGRAQRSRVDLDAMFIWSQMHGLASITQANVMEHLGLAAQTGRQMVPHAMAMIELAMDAATTNPASSR